jgi:hypothetical protein
MDTMQQAKIKAKIKEHKIKKAKYIKKLTDMSSNTSVNKIESIIAKIDLEILKLDRTYRDIKFFFEIKKELYS